MDVIIHCAWRVNLSSSLSSFDSNVRGVRNLIGFAHGCVNVSRLKFIYTSSITCAFSWTLSQAGPYPEETLLDAQFAVGTGYGESKYVSERVFITLFVLLRFVKFITGSL